METVCGNVPEFKSGDVVTFIGDSITHNGFYHSNIFLFYATRFPDRDFRYYNCGISGDTTQDVLGRFDRDIAVYKPNVATILLGMNDVGREHYGPDKTEPEHAAARKAALDVYRESISRLADLLAASGCRMIFITPPIYDQTAKFDADNRFGTNDALMHCVEFVFRLAEKHNASVVDFYSITNQVNHAVQKKDPFATVIGADRTHPGEPGHLLMTYEFLRAQNMPEYVSSITLDAAGGCFSGLINCRIEGEASVTPDAVTFDCLETSLPFPVSELQKPALDWIPFQQELNRQVLTVKNLRTGFYTLRIDGSSVGTYTAAEFTQGINLAENPATPQYIQALAVKAVNDERLNVARSIRAVSEINYRFLVAWNPIPDEEEPLRQALQEVLDRQKGQPWHAYMTQHVEKYMAIRHSGDDLHGRMEELVVKMHRVNKPCVHRWEIVSAGV
ncbi:MAG: SGNH/GDSL hydrolase family protein [Kiritimatiellales bacterium]|nr:SGNH/GDSL hydrolase family protein [Kiritimatiellales bacterium]